MSILRALLIVIVVVAVTFLLMGYFGGVRTREALSTRADIPQASDTVERARERGAEIGERQPSRQRRSKKRSTRPR